MDTMETPTETTENEKSTDVPAGDVDLAKIEAMVTPEQEHSASVARKRRTITRRRSSSMSKNRSKTPMRVSRIDGGTSSSDDDDGPTNDARPLAPGRKRERASRNAHQVDDGDNNGIDTEPPQMAENIDRLLIQDTKTQDINMDQSKKIMSESKRQETTNSEDLAERISRNSQQQSKRVKPKMTTDRQISDSSQNQDEHVKRIHKTKTSVDRQSQISDSSSQNQDEPIKQIKQKPARQNKISDFSQTQDEILKISQTKITNDLPGQISDTSQRQGELATKPNKMIESATNSDRQSVTSDNNSSNPDRRGSFPKQFEEQKMKIDKMITDNTKEIMSLLHRAKTSVEEKGKELRRRKFHKTEQKRSQSTPKQLTEAEVMESFRKAQAATAEREKERIRSSSARRYSSGSEKSPSPEPQRPARKPYRPVVQELLKQKKEQKQLKNKIKSNKIIEILDPKTSKVIATKEMGHVAKIKFFDTLKILRFYGPRQIIREYAKYKKDMGDEYKQIANQRRRCINHLLILMIFCGIGGIIFKFTEGAFENFYKCGVKRVKRDFIDLLWMKSHNLREDEWKSLARNKLRMFEDELHNAHEAGIHSYSGQKSWSFLNGIVYCLTVVTTIGYGHLYPTTKTGQALTIVYSLIGIPLFLIILTDFGKLFTRCIKFLWSFVRRLYYTGSCKSVRKTAQVQEIFKGAQMVYELATFRRPSMFDPNMNKNASPGDNSTEQNTTEPPTPAISNYEIDDEFNLPISVAILLLVLYILLGALLFGIWEGWDFFASFYFVFISMSTIGFGDYVPRHPIFMIVSIVYLVFGLALMSMCINVVQVKISDTFNQASAKIGATIGLGVTTDDGTIKPIPPKPVEIPQVHGSINDINSIKSGNEVYGPHTSRV